MPLSAIKQKLDSASDLSTLAFEVGLLTDAPMKVASKETRQKLHPIEDVPDILGVDIAFLRQLSDNDLIRIVRSPQNRELIDGRELRNHPSLCRAVALSHRASQSAAVRQCSQP